MRHIICHSHKYLTILFVPPRKHIASTLQRQWVRVSENNCCLFWEQNGPDTWIWGKSTEFLHAKAGGTHNYHFAIQPAVREEGLKLILL